MKEIDENIELLDGYVEPQVDIDDSVVFDFEHYKSHYLPRREVIELKKAKDE